MNSIFNLPPEFKKKLMKCCKSLQFKLHDQWQNKLKELDENTEEQLANELVEYSIKEFGEIQSPLAFSMAHFSDYWSSQQINTLDLPAHLKPKISRVHRIAINLLTERQKKKIDEYAVICINWAREEGYDKLTLFQIDSVLADRNIVLSSDAKHLCQIRVNNLLKT